MKRGVDIFLTVLAAPIWVPLAAVVAVAVRATLGRPVFFFDMRAGRLGRPFRLVKFRTMRTGDGSDEERMTRFGRFLRATSLDELPELWNVLKGDMSLVGPRPLPVRYLPRYTPQQNRRHEVRPGLTGWAQVNGRNALEWEEKFRYDIDYVDGMSLWLDAKILFLTAAQVLFPRNISHAGSATMTEFKGGFVMEVAKKYLDAREFLHDQWRLAAAVRASGWRPDWLVGLWRGGAPVAIAVHEFLKVSGWDVRHVPLKCASYDGIGSNEGEVVFTLGDEVFAMFGKGEKVLFVDDVFDTGKTAAAVARRMEGVDAEMKLACVYWKPGKNQTALKPDFFAKDIGDDWIVFPHEIDGLDAAEVREKSPLLAELLGES